MYPLHEAAKGGHVNVVKMLIAAGIKPSAQDIQLKTALHYAAKEGHVTVARLLAGNVDSHTIMDGAAR